MKKIRELIDNVGKKSPVAGQRFNTSDDSDTDGSYFINKLQHPIVFATNPSVDFQTMKRIDPLYFESETDPKLNELQALPVDVAIQTIEAKRNVLCSQLAAVTKKLSDVILENQPSYTKELTHVQELQRSLHNAFIICSNGRRHLNLVHKRDIRVNLDLLSNQQKENQLNSLCDALHTIKTLQHTDIRLREMLMEDDYDNAIQLCLECQQVASTYRQYSCIKDLSSKLQDTLEQIEEQIDVALSRTCHTFDSNIYMKLQIAYQLLGKTQAAADQLLMHYTTCIHSVAETVVTSFAESGSEKDDQRSQYKDICKVVERSAYIPCLLELCRSMWGIMHCYHATAKWHNDQSPNLLEDEEMRSYVAGKLLHGQRRVWGDVQSRIRIYLLSSQLSHFKYDDFILILDIIKRIMKVGEDFCKSTSPANSSCPPDGNNLSGPLHQQTLIYFHTHHRASLDELLMFIENEAWQPCPVKSSFNVLEMQEFKFLRKYDESEDDLGKQNEILENYFDVSSREDHPFADFLETNESSNSKLSHSHGEFDQYQSSDEEIADELLQDFVDEQAYDCDFTPSVLPRSSPSYSQPPGQLPSGPILTNTALHVLRLCGIYMKMGDVLKPIAVDVVMSMCQLFQVYFYSIVTCFSNTEELERSKHDRLHSTIEMIEQSIFMTSTTNDSGKDSAKTQLWNLRKPTLSSMIDLTRKESNYAVTERIVATESLVWLAEQFRALRKHMERLMPASKQPFIHQFFSQTVVAASDVRWAVFSQLVSHSLTFQLTIERMGLVDWNVDDIMTQHNHYVDQLLQELADFQLSFEQSVRLFKIPDAVMKVMWEQCIRKSNKSFVEGFSNVRRCSNEGRALMQLDYQQFLTKLEKLTNIRPTPDREFVESYIKAYYLIDNDLETWIRDHGEYSAKQLTSLVSCSHSSSYSSSSSSSAQPNTKQRVMSLIEDRLAIRR